LLGHDPERALEHFELAARALADDERPAVFAAMASYLQRKRLQAVAWLEQAVARNPKNSFARVVLQRVRRDEGDPFGPRRQRRRSRGEQVVASLLRLTVSRSRRQHHDCARTASRNGNRRQGGRLAWKHAGQLTGRLAGQPDRATDSAAGRADD
jgi:hypothetical protein